jgi:hypothetical protein
VPQLDLWAAAVVIDVSRLVMAALRLLEGDSPMVIHEQ